MLPRLRVVVASRVLILTTFGLDKYVYEALSAVTLAGTTDPGGHKSQGRAHDTTWLRQIECLEQGDTRNDSVVLWLWGAVCGGWGTQKGTPPPSKGCSRGERRSA